MPRPKGTPKTGGRQKGTPNRVNAASRDRIEQEADPIGFLIRIVRGEALEDEKPSLDGSDAETRNACKGSAKHWESPGCFGRNSLC
tara:strand:+ start:13 stop:270 length:258 start_codon:yes stop_codon:yes gene_type:complete